MFVLIVQFKDYVPDVDVYTTLDATRDVVDAIIGAFKSDDADSFFKRTLTKSHEKQGWVYMADSQNYWFGIKEVEYADR